MTPPHLASEPLLPGQRCARLWQPHARLILSFLVAGLLLTAQSAPAGERLALVIGNSDYPEGKAKLKSPVNDAQAMTDFLTGLGMKVTLLIDATVGEAEREFARLTAVTAAQPADELVIYYSGHGTVVADDDGDEGIDDELDEALVFLPGTSHEPTLLRDDVLFEHVQTLSKQTQNLIVVLDTCYASGLAKSATENRNFPAKAFGLADLSKWKGKDRQLLTSIQKESAKSTGRSLKQGEKTISDAEKARFAGRVVFLAAAKDTQVAAGEFEKGQSAFTYQLLRCLEEKPRQSIEQLYTDVSRRLSGTVESQEPVLALFGEIEKTAPVVGGLLSEGQPLMPAEPALPRANLGDVYVRISRPAHSATVRSLAFSGDSQALYSAGDDKLVRVWRLAAAEALDALLGNEPKPAWVPAPEPIVWEAGQGERGKIYALAISPADGSLVVGGLSHRGINGALTQIDPANGNYTAWELAAAAQGGHPESVVSLKISPDGQRLASQDIDGRVVWRSLPLGGDIHRLRDATGNRLVAKPLVFRDVATLVLAAPDADHASRWKLVQYDLNTGKATDLVGTAPAIHWHEVAALAADGTGKYLASADNSGSVYLWDGEIPQALVPGPAKKATCLSLTGKHLLAGFIDGKVAVWDLATKQSLELRPAGGAEIRACALSGDGRWAAFAQGNNVHVREIARAAAEHTFLGLGVQAVRLATAEDAAQADDAVAALTVAAPAAPAVSPYGVVFERADGQRHYYDPERGIFRESIAKTPMAPQSDAGWSVTPTADPQTLTIAGPNPNWKFKLRLDRWRHGTYAGIFRTVPRTDGARNVLPAGIAVATTGGYSSIFVYSFQADETGTLVDRPLRTFAGHEAPITGMIVTPPAPDKERYLVTSSLDGSVRYWSLHGIDSGKPAAGAEVVMQRWGFDLRLPADSSGKPMAGGQLFIYDIRDTGPAFQKGFRKGDVITSLQWIADDAAAQTVAPRPQEATDANQIWQRLSDLPWSAMPLFKISRGGKPVSDLQTRSAWHHTLAVAPAGREWIAWNPLGYFTSSLEGAGLVSWQVHSERPGERPILFTAGQKLELDQPELMKELLGRGTIDRRVAAVIQAVPPEVTIAQTRRIDDPDFDDRMSLEVVATVTPRDDHQLYEPQLLIDGKPGLGSRYQPTVSALGKGRQYQWRVDDLDRQRHLVRVHAFSQAGPHDKAEAHIDGPPPLPKRRLYFVSIGVGKYRDSRIPSLRFAAQDARAIEGAFASQFFTGSGVHSFYSEGFWPYKNGSQTGPLQDATYDDILASLHWLQENVSSRDVAVVFFSGHGHMAEVQPDVGLLAKADVGAKAVAGGVDPQFSQQGFLLPSDASLDERLKSPTEKRWISMDEVVRQCGEIKGTVMLVLDACHAGQSFESDAHRRRDFESSSQARRAVNKGDRLMIWASCLDHQKSYESETLGQGVFTYCLANLLGGQAGKDRIKNDVPTLTRLIPPLADGDGNKVVEPEQFGENFVNFVKAVGPALQPQLPSQMPSYINLTEERFGIAHPDNIPPRK
jgi:WD40 repeat protein/uncharacterized caspase-like protein